MALNYFQQNCVFACQLCDEKNIYCIVRYYDSYPSFPYSRGSRSISFGDPLGSILVEIGFLY